MYKTTKTENSTTRFTRDLYVATRFLVYHFKKIIKTTVSLSFKKFKKKLIVLVLTKKDSTFSNKKKLSYLKKRLSINKKEKNKK